MPFSGGTYTPPAPPTFPPNPGDVISSTYYISVINDIALALSVTMLRDGTVGWTGDIDANTHGLKGLSDGTVAAPGIRWNSNTGTGVYIDGSGNVCVAVAGVQVAQLGSAYTIFAGQTPNVLTFASTMTPDLTSALNFTVAMTGNATLANPSAMTPGSGGLITFTQDATGSRTLAFDTQWNFPTGVPALSTAASALDVLSYQVLSSSIIACSLTKGYVHS